MDVYDEIAGNNFDLAQENADIARLEEKAYDHLLSLAKQTQYEAEVLEDMLEAERRDHFFDNVKHWALILLGVAGAVL